MLDEDGYNLQLKQLMFILSLVLICDIPYFPSELRGGILGREPVTAETVLLI